MTPDRDQQQARELLPISGTMPAQIAALAAALADARAPGDQLRQQIEEIVADMTHAIDGGYYGGSEYEDVAKRLRAVLAES